MKMKPQIPTSYWTALVLFTVCWFCAINSARAQHPQNRSIDLKATSLYGLANLQIARFNVANIGNPNQRAVQVELLFLDSTGTVLAQSAQTVLPGRAVSFDLPFSMLATNENRIQLRSVARAEGPFEAIKNLKMSVELFDEDSGKTAVFIDDFN